MSLGLMFYCAGLVGCHNRAYSELYIENMAAEIRDLEDQLYEYDHEYRALEQELASLRHENSILRTNVPPPNTSRFGSSDGGNSRTEPTIGDTSESLPTPKSSAPKSSPSKPPSTPGETSVLEPPKLAPTPAQPKTQQLKPLPDPAETIELPESTPSIESRESRTDLEFDMDSLLPPTIEPGEPMPPPLQPSGNQSTGNNRLENHTAAGPTEASHDMQALEKNLSRIEVPAQLASDSKGRASVTVATEKVTDERVVELAFHPAMSRSANFDGDSDDDGLVLVLQPRNERGQMVPVAASLSIVALDPAREGDKARIGRWDYSAADVKAKLQPLGAAQGIQLTLPWNGPNPAADRVVVFARYTFEDGRQVIGQKEIFVTNDSGLRTVWSPRGNDRIATDQTRLEQSSVQVQHSEAIDDSAPVGRLVRPASAELPSQAAPSPSNQQPSLAW